MLLDADPPPAPTGWDDLTVALRALRARAGSPSYAELTRRVELLRSARGPLAPDRRPGRVTVYDAFRDGRSRLDVDLLADLVRALGGSAEHARRWRAAHAEVAGAPRAAAPLVTVEPVLRPLPESTPAIRGRDAALATLTAWAAGADGPRGAQPQIAALSGMPGVGTTALAHAAGGQHRAETGAVVLTGSGDLDPGSVIGALPVDPGAGALLVLDGVSRAADVAEIAAGAPGWRVLVTSHRTLVLSPVLPVTLGPLSPDASLALLGDLLGPARVAAEPEAARRLAEVCGHLPVGLVVSAGQVQHHPAWSLADHVHRVEASAHLLPALDTAYRATTAQDRLVLDRLALHPAALAPDELAVLCGSDEPSVRRSLAMLEDRHLVVDDGQGGVSVHALVRRLAVDAAERDEPVSRRRAAVARLAHHLLDECRAPVATVAPHHDLGSPAADPPTAARARARLDRLRATLTGTVLLCAEHGLADELGALSGLLAPYLELGAHWQDALAVHAAAAAHADPAGRSRAHRDLGRVLERLGRYDEALGHLVRAHESGDDPRPGQSLNRIGNVLKRLGRIEEALQSYAEAVEAARSAGDRVSEARATGNLADAQRLLGRHHQALSGYEAAAALSEQVGDVVNLAVVTANSALALQEIGDLGAAHERNRAARSAAEHLGDAGMVLRAVVQDGRLHLAAGRWSEAADALRDAIVRAAELGDQDAEADARTALGRALLSAGDLDAAAAGLEHALGLAQRLRATLVETEARNTLAALALRSARITEARIQFSQALALAETSGDTHERLASLIGLGDCALAEHDPATARDHWQSAADVGGPLGLPLTREALHRLGRLTPRR